MGLKLCFKNDEMKAIQATAGATCELCNHREATWEAAPIQEHGTPIKVCAHCAMYSVKTKWGYENREELLNIGRYCQLSALKNGKEVPMLDERGRLEPMEAERFLMGVAFSTLVLRKLGRGRGLDSMSH